MEAKKISQKDLLNEFRTYLEEKGFDIQQEVGLCLSDIPKTHMRKGKNGKIYCDIVVGIRKEPDQWGRDLKVYIKPTQKDREAKEPKCYVGGGKTFIFASENDSAVVDADIENLYDDVKTEEKGNLPF